jgi:hypothetical protein
LVVWNMFFSPFSWGDNPNWRTPSFFRVVGWNHQAVWDGTQRTPYFPQEDHLPSPPCEPTPCCHAIVRVSGLRCATLWVLDSMLLPQSTDIVNVFMISGDIRSDIAWLYDQWLYLTFIYILIYYDQWWYRKI